MIAEERDISLDEIYDDNNEKPKHLHQSKFHPSRPSNPSEASQ